MRESLMSRGEVARRTLPAAEDTRRAGAWLATALRAAPSSEPWLIGLSGELGAGKTTFVAGLLAALGYDGPARSPTFTFVEPYRLDGRDILHCDLYRCDNPRAIDDLGLRDLLVPRAVLLVEWPTRAGNRLSGWDLDVRFDYAADASDGRIIEFVPRSTRGAALLGGGLDGP
jgi:tRNA threonylcarbamoyladenosine biosynthesis protein TsaE